MSARRKNLAGALLDAHVAFMVEQLSGPGLPALVEEELDALLDAAGTLTLDAAMDRQTIKDTIRVFAVQLQPGPGLPELVGDIARKLHEHEIHDRTRLGQVLSDKLFTEIVDKALEMKSAREALLHALTSSPAYLAFASDLVYHGIKGYLADNPVMRGVPGVRSMAKLGKAVIGKAGLEGQVDDSLRKYIRQSVKATARASERMLQKDFDSDAIRTTLLDAWASAKQIRISELRKHVASRDVEESFVIAYEYWHELRRSEIYSALIEAGVDGFFDKYGASTLREILDELGVTRELMLAEALRYAGPAIKVLNKKKLLDKTLRRNLARFYDSPAAAAVLDAAR